MTLQLEQYLDNLESLPVELKRNFSLMKNLDTRSVESLTRINILVNEYLAGARTWSADKRDKQLKEIQELYNKAKGIADDKVRLSQRTYDMVDRHIRRLDSDLARFEGQLKEKIFRDTGTNKKRGRKTEDNAATSAKKKKQQKVDSKQYDDEIPKISDKERKKKLMEMKQVNSVVDPVSLCSLSSQALIQTLATAAGDVMDMPVDPNEPTYCLCHQVSYGEMIGCDNVDCPIEWFHFGCVGLSNKPKGKWYCPRCSDERKKNK